MNKEKYEEDAIFQQNIEEFLQRDYKPFHKGSWTGNSAITVAIEVILVLILLLVLWKWGI